MKINLSREERAGYDEQVRNIEQFAELVDDGEAVEILALGLLEGFALFQLDHIIKLLASKLAHGGTLIVDFVDYNLLAKALINKNISMYEVNKLTFGKQVKLTMDYVVNKFKELGLQVAAARFVDLSGIVTLERM